ncbi:MAG: chlorite dismutase, partial [Ktedonobacteraceae bacterium]|nr:chlorite dismutase [Ktedonobacteraceae bacterium]
MAQHTTTAQPEQAADGQKTKQPRQLVRFAFYKLDPQWQMLSEQTRLQGRQEALALYDEYAESSLLRSYSLYG